MSPDVDVVEFQFHADPHKLQESINEYMLDLASPKNGGPPIAKIINITFMQSNEAYMVWIHSRGY